MKIMIVEDDKVTLEAMTASLRSEGFAVVATGDGSKAVALREREKPDVICLDIMMPGVDGYEVCRRIRAADAATPILFVSAKNEEVDVVLGLELGADDFIRKPFGRRELLARIRAVLRRAGARAPAPRRLKMRDLVVYPDELRAERGKTAIELSPREASILALLYENAGRPLDRDTLLNRCWGMEYFPESRTLDQHIVNLRKRIERDPAAPDIIETVRGVGYRYRP